MKDEALSRKVYTFRDSLRKDDIAAVKELVRSCDEEDGTNYEPPLDGDFYILCYGREASKTELLGISCVWHLGQSFEGEETDELRAFVLPRVRGQGIFKEMLFALGPKLRRSICLSVYEVPYIREVLEAIGAEYIRSEHMMELSLDSLPQKNDPDNGISKVDSDKGVAFSDEQYSGVSRAGTGELSLSSDERDGGLLSSDIGEAGYRLYGDRAYIYGVLVYSRFRGRGMGRKFMTELLLRLKESGCTSVFLQVASDNVPALKLYESLGFKTAETMLSYVLRLHRTKDLC